jgi:hypothetical protein
VIVRTLQLDFLQPTGRRSRLGPWLLLVGAIAAVAAMAYQNHLAGEVAARDARLTALRGIASRSLPSLSGQDSDTPEMRDQIKKANAVLQIMNVPWGELFAAVESAEDGSVALLAVQPDSRSRSVLIGGQARSLPAVFAYMGRLERTNRLRDVVMVNHELKSKEPGQPVDFTLSAGWREER